MKTNFIKSIFILFLLGFSTIGIAQVNIQVNKLYTDLNCSSFEITIQDSVRLHYHSEHTENIFVLSGKARMRINEKYTEIKSGDHLIIPKGSQHAVWVTSEIPLKVISVQSPEFKGKDRHFVNE